MNVPGWIERIPWPKRIGIGPSLAKPGPAGAMRKKILRALGYTAFFFFWFFFFVYFTFPYDRLREYIIAQVEAGSPGRPSPWELEIIDLSPSFITGVSLEGVRLAKKSEDPNEPNAEILIDELDLRISLLPLLFGTFDVDFDAEVAGGSIEGTYSISDGGEPEETSEYLVDLENVDLRRLGIIRSFFSLPLVGRLSGHVDVTLGPDDEHTVGEVHLSATGVEIGDGQAKLKLERLGDGLTIEKLAAGNLDIEIQIENGVAKVRKLEARGTDLHLEGAGEIHLARPFGNSRIDVMLRATVEEAYRRRSDRTRALFSLFDLNPVLRAAKTSDGAIQYRLNGTFSGQLRGSPAGRAEMPQTR
jgi:type II secretion system protein N